jgi:2,3-bisphosphoglycerate-dependent phosphoglycerate mutase
MTTIYFVRHAEPDFNVHNDMERPLTDKGKRDCLLVTEFLQDKKIDVVFSSPFIRAVDTVKDFADRNGLKIIINSDFRERKVDSIWIDDFQQFTMNQWNDFDFKLSDGECLREVQGRNIKALKNIMEEFKGQNIVIGSHGTALSTIIHYYNNSFGYEGFNSIRYLMPFIVKFTFDSMNCIDINLINLFEY